MPVLAHRTVLLAAVIGFVALVTADRPASGALTGQLVVSIDASFAEPAAAGEFTVARAAGVERLSGLLEGAADVDGVVIAFDSGDVARPIVVGSLWSSHESPPESIACGGVVCALDGPVIGSGRLELAEVDPVAGGRVSLRIVVRRAHCERCP